MRWTSPPTRRELTLLLFAFTVFLLFYDIDSSLRVFGYGAADTQQRLLRSLGFKGSQAVIEQDGRKATPWRDELEVEIFGEWEWEEGEVAGESARYSQGKGVGQYGAMWQRPFDMPGKEPTVTQAIENWDNIPLAKSLVHVPGYTVLENVILFNRSVYLVSDGTHPIPDAESISSSMRTWEEREWKVITTEEARTLLPKTGGRISGTTWISSDPKPDVTTLFALWKAQSLIDKDIDASGHTELFPPHLLFFQHIPAYSDPRPADILDLRVRTPSNIGFPPLFARSAFPDLGIMFKDDWSDYQLLESPFVLETVVIADRALSPSLQELLELSGSKYWFEPVRQSLAMRLGTYEEKSYPTVVTYIHKQADSSGLRLQDEEHTKLIDALKNMGRSYEVQVVSSEDNWKVKMTAVTRSTIVLGVHGDHLFDSVFMKTSTQPTLMEFFPANTFSAKNQQAANAVGGRYMAWWNNVQFVEKLPEASEPKNERVQIDVQAVIKAIRQYSK